MTAPPPQIAPTPDAAVGQLCPYCQCPHAAGEQAALCSVCGATHHADCWTENGGCAVPGCAAGPRLGADGTAIAPAPRAPAATAAAQPVDPQARIAIPMDGQVPATGVAPAAAAPSPGYVPAIGGFQEPVRPGRGNARRVLLLTLAILVAGGAAAFALMPASDSGSSVGDPGEAVGTTPQGSSESPTSSDATSMSRIAERVESYTAALARGDASAATGELSANQRRRFQGTDQGDRWKEQVQTIGKGVADSGAEATKVERYADSKPSEGVVRLNVSGVRWPDNPRCQTMTGIMWAVYEGDDWYLEVTANTSTRRIAQFGYPDGNWEAVFGARCLGEPIGGQAG